LDGKDVFRHTHSPRFLSKSTVARYSTVSYLNTGNGFNGGQVPARMDFISACWTEEVNPAMLALVDLMIRPKKLCVQNPVGGEKPVL
jgi:hypothetical protein